MKILIKLGGTLLDEPAKRNDLAHQLASVAKQAELDKAKEACASSSVAAPNKKGKR